MIKKKSNPYERSEVCPMSRVTPQRRRKRKAAPIRSRRRAAAGKRKHGRVKKNTSLKTRAWRLGRIAGESGAVPGGDDEIRELQKRWASEYRMLGNEGNNSGYIEAMNAYVEGYFSASGRKPENWLLLPTEQSVGAVVMAMNEELSLASAIEELERLPLHEIVIIVNGSTDNSLTRARTSGRAVVLHYSSPLGHDVGRAIGARVSVSDIMLFVDADIPIQGEKLLSFIRRTAGGLDVALNDLSPFIGQFDMRDEVTILKEFLNRSVGRPDLTVNSMTAVPHALTRRAIETIGAAHLAVPPKAQAIALKSGLRVDVGGSVDVITRNRVRKMNTGAGNEMIHLIIGDHLEALEWTMGKQEPRLKYVDSARMRRLT
ncbi:glycosyltransferase [Paenibacillus sp. NEAU-GSW1]|uniref:glycosyltransferase family 2 protein n=1 Tax=Paenibacillus sp. NEAU-GSW1 TaxID=2682486 RepID=UPI0012E2E31F|nr:glycosyltransferase [Paenibacillus sp. NEAU-GSW1]MUT68738.1 glycosyltransferase [Paenibacillus sp. NEAU-GSW1]